VHQLRVSSRAPAVAERAARRTSGTAQRVQLPRRYGRLIVTLICLLLGAAAAGIYARIMVGRATLLVMSLAATGGAVLGYLAFTVPRVLLHFFRKQWYRVLARHWDELWRQTTTRALRDLEDREGEPDILVDLGIAYYLRGDCEQAVSYLTQARQKSDATSKILNALAAAEAGQGHWEEAVDALVTAARLGDDDSQTLSNLAVLLAEMPQGSQFEKVLHDALPAEGASALNNLAVREIQCGNLAAATQHLREVTRQKPWYAHGLANIGVVAFRTGDFQSAALNLAAAVQLGGNHPDFLANLGGVLTSVDDLSGAGRVLRLARRLDPAHGPATINAGCLYLALGRYEDALDEFRSVHDADGLRAIARHDAALASAGIGEYRQAEEYELQAREARPEDPEIETSLGAIYWYLGRHREARQQFENVLTLDPESLRAAVNLARGEIAAGQPGEAVKILRDLGQRYADDMQVLFDTGVAHLVSAVGHKKEDMTRTDQLLFASALALCIDAFEKNANHKQGIVAESQFNLALAYYLREDLELAAEQFQRALKLLPGDADNLLCVGTALAEYAQRVQKQLATRGDELVSRAAQLLRKARSYLKKAAEDPRARPDVLCNLGLVCHQLGDTQEAIKVLRRFIQVEPTAEANNNLALVYAKQGHEVNQSVVLAHWLPEPQRRLLVSRARSLLSTALHYFFRALRAESANPVLHCNIGLAYMLRNRGADVQHALDHWQLMRRTGGEWGEQQYQRLMQVTESQETAKVRFLDAQMVLRSIDVVEMAYCLSPLMGEILHAIEPVMDRGQWELHATHPQLKIALRIRRKLSALQERLRRLGP